MPRPSHADCGLRACDSLRAVRAAANQPHHADDSVWEFMTGLNESRIQIAQKHAPPSGLGDVITFSHFLPRKEVRAGRSPRANLPLLHHQAFLVLTRTARVRARTISAALAACAHADAHHPGIVRVLQLPLPGVHEMAKASGCLKVEEQLRRVGSRMHIFGHTHINTQNEYEGVVYMQNAMGYGIAPGTRLPVVHENGHFKSYMA